MHGPTPERPLSASHLVLPARPEALPRVRRAVEEAAAEAQLPEPVIADIRLAVTEACTNVMRHAYDPHEAIEPAIEVRLEPAPGVMRIVVEDQGRGLGTSHDTSGPGLGLALIAALASWLEVGPSRTRGTRLSMCFAAGSSRPA